MELEQRVEKLEHAVSSLREEVVELRVDVALIKGALPALAKQEDIAAIKSQLPFFATHADISHLLMWLIGVGLASVTSIVIGILNYLK